MENNYINWQCRRGMLELDEFLLEFVAHYYKKLSSNMQAAFQELLTHSDVDLLDWLTGKTEPEDPELATLVALILAKYNLKS